MPDEVIDPKASILLSTKKVLGIDAAFDHFDLDIIMFANSALADLSQIGLGPELGFEIEDDSALWVEFLGNDPRLNSAKSFVHQKVRLAFDPPGTSFAITAIEKQLEEKLVRLSIQREGEAWREPTTPTTPLPIGP